MNSKRLTVIVCVVLSLFLTACKDKKEQEESLVRSVKTIVVTSASTLGTRQLSGVLKPTDESDLSFQVAGTVKSVEVKLGDSVKKGQLLATMDSRDFELRLESAQASLASAKANLAATSEDLKRQEALKVKGFASQANVDKARAKYEATVSQEKIDLSKIEKTTRDLERTQLLAPFDGKISLRSIEPHQETQVGRMVFKLQSEQGLKVEVLVPESLIRGLKPKQSAMILFPTLKNIQVPAVIREIAAQSNVANAFTVTLDLSETKADLRAGMSAQVIFNWDQGRTSPIYLIPLSAIDTRPQATGSLESQPTVGEKIVSVFLFDKDESKVKHQIVTVGGIQGNQIEVLKGLKDGDVLVTAGVPFLENGQKVTLWQQKYRSPETDK